jgi:MFS family permease
MGQQTSALARVVPFFYGWWVAVAALVIMLVVSAGPLYVFSTLVDPLEEEFGWSRAAIGAGPSIAALMAGLVTPVAGYLVDRVGARRLLVTGATLVGAGSLATSQIQALWQFYISVSVIAVGMTLAGLLVLSVAIAHWFVRRRGRAMGVMSAGAGASGLMVLLAAVLIAQFGWRSGLMILGLGQLATCIPLALTVPHRPQEMGLLPDGDSPATRETPAGAAPEPIDGPGEDGGTGRPEGLTMGDALRTRPFWLLAVALILAWVGALAVIVHVIAYLDEAGGFTEEGAAVIAMGIPFGSLVGRIIFGWLADYLSKRWLLAGAWMLQGLGILVLAAVHSPWQAVIFLVVLTPGWGGAVPVLPALMAEYFGLRAFGGIQGLLMATAMLGGFAGPIFAGAVYDVTDSYRPAFLMLGLAGFAASLAIAMLGRRPAWTGRPVVASGA